VLCCVVLPTNSSVELTVCKNSICAVDAISSSVRTDIRDSEEGTARPMDISAAYIAWTSHTFVAVGWFYANYAF
jgi:hypothetical protein